MTARESMTNLHTPTPARPGWQDDAPCSQIGPHAFFVTTGNYPDAAIDMCWNQCEVRRSCLETAMAMEGDSLEGHRAGLWGGFTPKERRALALQRREREVA